MVDQGYLSWQERWHRRWKRKRMKPEGHISTRNKCGRLLKMRLFLCRTGNDHGWSHPKLLVSFAGFLNHEYHYYRSLMRQKAKPKGRMDISCNLKQKPYSLDLILTFHEGSNLFPHIRCFYHSRRDFVLLNPGLTIARQGPVHAWLLKSHFNKKKSFQSKITYISKALSPTFSLLLFRLNWYDSGCWMCQCKTCWHCTMIFPLQLKFLNYWK